VFNHPNYTFFIRDKRPLHAFQGYNSNSWLRMGLQRVFARPSPFTRGTFYLFFVQRPLHIRDAYVWRAPLTGLGPLHTPSLRHRSISRCRLHRRKAPRPPMWLPPVRHSAFSSSSLLDRTAPSAPKPYNAEPTAYKSAPVNSTHAVQTKLALLLTIIAYTEAPSYGWFEAGDPSRP
jgi:hypothetical protein